MLNTQKLLYILPDVALIVELLPGKKPHSFAVQSFRQINGEYIGEEELIGVNIVKLFSKLEPESYHLILPDEVFTNTIVSVAETSDSAIASYVKDKLLPSLELSIKSHQIDTTVLTTFKGQSKIQLSALEQSLLSPLRAAAEFSKVTITAISPLSWTVKALISLEPSISVLQLGSNLFASLHYIGVDQALQAPIDTVDAIAETIRTLKGSEPNIQTIYLFSNALIEEKLKELLSDSLPIQQLASLRDEDGQLPSYVKEIVESGMKTLSITDYPVPRFALGKATPDDLSAFTNALADSQTSSSDVDQADDEETAATDIETLPEPEKPNLLSASTASVLPATFGEEEPVKVEERSANDDSQAEPSPLANSPESVLLSSPKKLDLNATEPVTSTTTKEEPSMPPTPSPTAPSESQAATPPATTEGVDLTQFVPAASNPQPVATSAPTAAITSSSFATPPPSSTPAVKSPPIKNQSGVSSMMKMIIVILLAFLVTVGAGLAVGYFMLNRSGSSSTTPVPTPEPTVAQDAIPTPEPTPTLAAVDRAELSILVVNATTKAGYAGQISTKLDEAGFGTTSTGNAKGDYASASADLALMTEEDPALVATLSQDTGLTLTFAEGIQTEDPQGTYDAVVVLTQ